MYQNDYILREIEGLTRFLGKILFHKQQETEEIIDEQNLVSGTGLFRHTLFRMLSEGEVNEAENLLHERLEAEPRREYLQLALDFYAELGKWSEEELIRCGFSREEIRDGLDAVRQYYVDM